MARVVIVREANHLASWFVFKLYQNDGQVGKLKNKSYFDGYLNSGDSLPIYTFGHSKDSLALIESPQPGATYYLLLEVVPAEEDTNSVYKRSDFTYRLSEITKETANKIIIDGYLNRLSTEDMTPFAALHSNYGHIGIRTASGVGFSSYDAFEKTNGGYVKISPGGGSLYGVKLGYTFNRFFDGTAGAAYQVSTLSQILNNASGNFGRFILSGDFLAMHMLTEKNFLGIGSGISSYKNPRLMLDATRINNEKVILYYKDAIGYQVFLEWRLLIKRVCLSANLRYSTVSYDLNRITLNGVPAVIVSGSGEDYQHLDGGGLDLELGFGYLF